MNKQNKKLNSEQRKLEQASIYTSTYSHTYHKNAMYVSRYQYKEIFTLISISLNLKRKH